MLFVSATTKAGAPSFSRLLRKGGNHKSQRQTLFALAFLSLIPKGILLRVNTLKSGMAKLQPCLCHRL